MHRPQTYISRLSCLVLIRSNQTENHVVHIRLCDRPAARSPALLVRNSLILFEYRQLPPPLDKHTTYEIELSDTQAGSSPPSDFQVIPKTKQTLHS
jgi:hypothetical protein